MKKFTEKQTDNFNRKLTGILVVIVGIVLTVGIAFIARFADLSIVRQKIFGQSQELSKKETVTINGAPTCLPLKNDSDGDKQCILGIKTSSDEHYAISGGSDPLELYGEIGSSEFEVTGELIKAGDGEKYKIKGTIIRQ